MICVVDDGNNISERPKAYGDPTPWIDVSERLPENGQFVIVYLPAIEPKESHFDACQITHVRFLGGKFIEPFSDTIVSRPLTHWMPLPEPPK